MILPIAKNRIGGVIIIQAVLASKSLGYEYTEDILTSTAFGALRYINPDKALVPFLESAFIYNADRTTLWQRLNNDGINLRSYRSINYVFWPFNVNHGEPDLILIFSDHIHDQEDLLILVEAKFKSHKSGINENDQLARYFDAIKDDLEHFSNEQVAGFNGKRGYIVYLTENQAHTEIADSCKVINSRHNGLSEVFQLQWYQLYQTLESMSPYCSGSERIVANDLMKYLEKLGLRNFSGVPLPKDALAVLFAQAGPAFYQLDAMKFDGTYFDLPVDVDFNRQNLIFYRGNNDE